MHVFLAGATGVLGRRIVPGLVEAGHRVTGVTRHDGGGDLLRSLGATPVVADAKDLDAMVTAVTAAAPDVVMNQLTDLRTGVGPANGELRLAGSAALAAAVRAADVPRVIAQSIAWAYVPGSGLARETERLDVTAPDPRGRTVRTVATVEESAAVAPEWVVLRYGMFYGPDTWYAADGLRGEEARAGQLVPDSEVTSFVHVDDAARAAIAALEWPTGAVNVCDDEPADGHTWLPAFCAAVGAEVPAPGPARAAEPWARGADNTRLRSELGFELEHTSWRTGFGLPG
jgi:nucleoside-diphosphate-sugar epimerase